MSFRLRQIAVNDKLCQQDYLRVFHDLYGPERISALLSQTNCWEEREHKLNMVLTLTTVIALSLFPHASQAAVVQAVTIDLQLLWPDNTAPSAMAVTEAAVCYRRTQLGIRPLYELFATVCQPLATAQTRGAFRFGRRVMTIDATLELVADTAANVAFFGRINTGKTRSPFPQLRCTYLAECGTHAIVDAILSPCRQHEARKALDLLPSIHADMLVTLDRGVVSGALLWGIRQQRAHALGRLESPVLRTPSRILSDGTYLTFLRVRTPRGWYRLPVRVIEYTLPVLPLLAPEQQSMVMQRLLTQMSYPLLPPRRLRFNARVVKRPFSKFKRKYPVHLHAYHRKDVFREMVRLRILLI
ncbi:MAG TPA: transposase domain-containing protein [Ktedonobacteraceae bacterium]|nr:transposase domain-containing protein [Ktedonobacteraceae bacterium]